MPEGHTIHRLARDHTKWFAGESLRVSSPQGRFSTEAQRITGKTLQAVEAYGKHLFYRWDSGHCMHVHLGLYGKFRLHRNPPPTPQGQVRVRMQGGERSFDLNGPNQCELLGEDGLQRLLQRIGPDPLRSDADPDGAWKRISRSRAAIGGLLLNQSVVSGIGNIYRSELLYLLGIHPDRPGQSLTRQEFDELWELTVKLMRIGVKYNRIITVDPQQMGKPYSRLAAKERLLIYKAQSCPRCEWEIDSWLLAGRMIYACARCQV